MKKLISIITIICLLPLMGVSAQEKAEKQYLPEEGDWAIGIDVVPLLKYVGNAFNGSQENEIESLGGAPFTKNNKNFRNRMLMPDVSIMGKYMLTDEWALRANVGIMVRSEYDRRYVKDDKAALLNPLSNDKVIDKAHHSRNGMSIAVGAEYRKGSKRVQGVFGAGLLFAFQNDKTTYSWGNEMTTINQNPSIAFDRNNETMLGDNRILKNNGQGSDFYTGITGSAGVEWFIAPKISLGAEVNLSLYYLFGNQTYIESEGYNTSTQKIETRTDLVSPGNRGFYIGTESLGGSLNMTFYF
ncbi:MULTISPECIES: hypothetical protein [unclassified Bacteroides]|jgi:hypothetical protein|uniref:hypothetical protein n=1 Tax=unclassified Bacteroides TaxID=2646097 RepID=UPI000E9B4DFC|nr:MULTISPECIES: hypothetical protein [unclassified Bacteroides]RGN46076.1 hypothetical protein DXB63_11795 [Bacteroides sp. OM05-12]RHR74064.1 hypothetical protein DWW69_13640 [Bacteroides sp. AF16-49]